MPKAQHKQSVPRQRPVSCRFCRNRKLRCSREAPCSNCVSRGLECELEEIGQATSTPRSSDPAIVERLQRLEKLLTTRKKAAEDHASWTPESHTTVESEPPPPSVFRPASTALPQVQSLDSDVAWLESIYTGQPLTNHKISSSQVAFKICPIQQITGAQSHICQHEFFSATNFDPLRCIWLPQQAEAQVLLNKFLSCVNHFPYVVNIPTLPSMLKEIYTDLSQQRQLKPGQVILLLSVFAAATHSWVQNDCDNGVFQTPAEANDQTMVWIKATQDVLDIVNRTTTVSIEGVQGFIIISFVLTNLEGTSRRCQSLYTTALLLARELGLHRIDHPNNTATARTAQAEIGRRVWWYLCSSDWLIAARFAGVVHSIYSCHPRQMVTKKPLNINDDEIFDGMNRLERSLSQPTSMSYLLQRIRLSEVSRNIVDRAPLSMAHLGGPSHDDIMDIDTELQTIINDVPAFFTMSESKLIEIYGLNPQQAADIRYQGFAFLFLLYSQRCKLHLPFFTRGFVDTAYASSREICVKSASLIITHESQLQSASTSSAIRFKFSALLLGVFMATIVLLMDLCVNKQSSYREKRRQEVTEAFQMLEAAKNESPTTAKFVDSLMLILKKHEVSPLRPTTAQMSESSDDSQHLHEGTNRDMSYNTATTQAYQDSTGHALAMSFASAPESAGNMNMPTDRFMNSDELSSYFQELAQTVGPGNDGINFDWNNMFSGFDSSFM